MANARLSWVIGAVVFVCAASARGEEKPAAPEGAVAPAPAPPAPAPAPEKKSMPALTVYGRLNISFDYGDQGLSGMVCKNPNLCTATDFTGAGSTGPVGQLGFLPDLASNLSRFGVRGGHDLGDGYAAIYQAELQIDAAATPGSKPNGNNDTTNPGNNAVAGGFSSRDTFVGVASPYGSLKAGKGDTPYKRVTGDFDFLGETPADYNSIMGNTGGDNRTEFDARLPHALWYDSPDISGLHLAAMWSPGQNRFPDNIGFAIGEPVCAGGNSGPCNDGSFGDGWSFAADWHGFGLKAILSYELHKRANRTGDSGQPTPFGNSFVATADESALKFGAKYTVAASGTTVAGIYEDFRRHDVLNWNERQRSGFFIGVSQKLGEKNEAMASFIHANASPGDPTSGPSPKNAASEIGVGVRHKFDAKTSVYLVYAYLANDADAHYALGPGGHGVTWDCKDGSGPGSFADSTGTPIGLEKNGTQCFTGTTSQAFSLGMSYDF
jgi:predicted porin